MVSTDISCDHTPTTVGNTPSTRGSTVTPTSFSNKRKQQKKQEEEEKWYSKSWMCGFTDALEALNLKP